MGTHGSGLYRRASATGDGTCRFSCLIFSIHTSFYSHLPLFHTYLILSYNPGDTEVNPVLGKAKTPLIYNAFKGLLFVRLAHNLLLESYVSRLATIEKRNPRTHALLLDHMFLYKARQTKARAARCTAALRTSSGGGLTPKSREKAAEARPLKGSPNGSKKQLLLLCVQVNEKANTYSTKEMHVRKAAGLWQRLRAVRESHDSLASNLAMCKVWHQQTTCYVTPTGRKRKVATPRTERPNPKPMPLSNSYPYDQSVLVSSITSSIHIVYYLYYYI